MLHHRWLCLLAASSPTSMPISVGAIGLEQRGEPVANDFTKKVESLPFSILNPPEHQMTVDVGVYFEHLWGVDSSRHTFSADFWQVYRWRDPRNYTALFENNSLVEVHGEACGHTSNPHRRLQQIHRLVAPGTRYLEIDHGSLQLFWLPDLHIRNRGAGETRIYAELAHLYEDGTFEFLQLAYANLVLVRPYYGAYPFDEQRLTVQVESLAHTTKQIRLAGLATFSGVGLDQIQDWPGWTRVEGGIKWGTDDEIPQYVHEAGNSDRCERRSRYQLDIVVKRHYLVIVETTIAPLVIQLCITWVAFYINVKVLMPRVSVSFISYLTLSNAATSLNAGLPPVTHAMFIDIFILLQRLMVIVGLLETASCWYITESISTRVGSSLDRFSRVVVPLDYMLLILVFFFLGHPSNQDLHGYEDRLKTLAILTWVNFFSIILAGALWCAYYYRRLSRQMIADPLKFYMTARHKHLDSNELHVFFQVFDNETDGQIDGIVSVATVIKYIIEKAGRPMMLERYDDITAAVLAKIPGKRHMLDLEEFIAHFRPMMGEIAHWAFVLNFEKLNQATTVVQQAVGIDERANGNARHTDTGTAAWTL